MEKVIDKESLELFIAKLNQKFRVFAPVDLDVRVVWGEIESFSQISRDYLESKQTKIMSPKGFFFKEKEDLLKFSAETDKYSQINEKVALFVLFGDHTCDIHGIKLMDKVFSGKYIVEHVYLA